MSVSKAHSKATAKYNAKTYKTFSVNAKLDEYKMISEYCEKNGISKNSLVLSSVKYCIENNIDLKNE